MGCFVFKLRGSCLWRWGNCWVYKVGGYGVMRMKEIEKYLSCEKKEEWMRVFGRYKREEIRCKFFWEFICVRVVLFGF